MPLIPKSISDTVALQNPELAEELSGWGRMIYEQFDTEALLRLMKFMEELGYRDVAENIYEWYKISEDYWATRYWEETGDVIVFDPDVMRWRSMVTGRFVKDPYKYLWYE